jgi:hypothetical protein
MIQDHPTQDYSKAFAVPVKLLEMMAAVEILIYSSVSGAAEITLAVRLPVVRDGILDCRYVVDGKTGVLQKWNVPERISAVVRQEVDSTKTAEVLIERSLLLVGR